MFSVYFKEYECYYINDNSTKYYCEKDGYMDCKLIEFDEDGVAYYSSKFEHNYDHTKTCIIDEAIYDLKNSFFCDVGFDEFNRNQQEVGDT